jgi:hypothetical protein
MRIASRLAVPMIVLLTSSCAVRGATQGVAAPASASLDFEPKVSEIAGVAQKVPYWGPPGLRIAGGNGAPSGCTAQDVAHRFEDLLRALSAGETGIAEKFFHSAPSSFYWFSLGDLRKKSDARFALTVESQDSLPRYFDRKPFAGTDLRLTRITFLDWDAKTNHMSLAPFEFDVNPTDSLRRGYAGGKGGYDCETRSFNGMSLSIFDEPPFHSAKGHAGTVSKK